MNKENKWSFEYNISSSRRADGAVKLQYSAVHIDEVLH